MAKTAGFIIIVGLFSLLTFSCAKDPYTNKGVSSLNIVNASTVDYPLYVYFTFADSNYYLQNDPLYPGSNYIYSLEPGKKPLSFVAVPDTSKPLLQTYVSLRPGTVNTFFLSGTDGQVDTLVSTDTIPTYADSAAGVRVVNLSPGSQPMSINLAGNPPDQAEFSSIGYRELTQFKKYTGSNGVNSYNFEVRDQATGNLLTTYSWYFSLFKNYTLVISGSEDPSNPIPLGVFTVNNF